MQSFYLFGSCLLLYSYIVQCSFAFDGIGLNLTEFFKHRQKRALIFEGGGILKLAIGPILPFDLADPVPFRSALSFYNLQGGEYALPRSPIYHWNKWEDTISRSRAKKAGRNAKSSGFVETDETRLFAYAALENYMNGPNVDGVECLLRAICENAQIVQHIGLLAELLNVLLTPGKEGLSPAYRNAYQAGKSGADCVKMHRKCPAGASWLDQYLDVL